MVSTASFYTIINDVYDPSSHALNMVLNYVHTHGTNSEGGQLDWDNVWSDAVHSHASNAEGGSLAHSALLGLTTGDDHTQYVQESLLTAQGDIPYATGSATWSKIVKGSALTFLRVNSGGTGYDFATGSATKEFFAPFDGANKAFSYYPSAPLPQSAVGYASFVVPANYSTTTSVYAYFYVSPGGTIDYTFATYSAGSGTSITTGIGTATADGLAVGTNTMQVLDITSAFYPLVVGRPVSCAFTNDEGGTVGAIGINVKYS